MRLIRKGAKQLILQNSKMQQTYCQLFNKVAMHLFIQVVSFRSELNNELI